MKSDCLEKKVKGLGFNSIDDFVRSNLGYLSYEKLKIFYSVDDFNKQYGLVD